MIYEVDAGAVAEAAEFKQSLCRICDGAESGEVPRGTGPFGKQWEATGSNGKQ